MAFLVATESSPGSFWPQLVQQLVTLEQVLGFPSGKVTCRTFQFHFHYLNIMSLQSEAFKLSAKGRPTQITHWINCGRKFTHLPVIPDLVSYVASFNNWWRSLQPETRVVTEGVITRDVEAEESWEKTRKGGVNGFVTVLICLAVWLRSTSSETEREICEVAIQDVLWVVERMISRGNAPKRALEDVEDVEDVTSVK